jgi:Zn-dependent protease with chaperone function
MDNQENNNDTDLLMEDIGESLGYLQSFISQEVESVKLEVAEKISIASSSVITIVALTAIGGFVFIFAATALGFYLGTLLNSYALGFLIVSLIFLALLLIIYIFRKRLITDRVVTAVIHLFFDQDEDENHS